jgi:hypothetical protein
MKHQISINKTYRVRKGRAVGKTTDVDKVWFFPFAKFEFIII